MRNQKRYAKNFKKRARAVKERQHWCCLECGVRHGTVRVSKWTGKEWPVYLQGAHINHDPENEDAEIVGVCPRCHWHYYRRPGQRPTWMIERIKHQRLIAVAYCVY
jgi:hypothetical protein